MAWAKATAGLGEKHLSFGISSPYIRVLIIVDQSVLSVWPHLSVSLSLSLPPPPPPPPPLLPPPPPPFVISSQHMYYSVKTCLYLWLYHIGYNVYQLNDKAHWDVCLLPPKWTVSLACITRCKFMIHINRQQSRTHATSMIHEEWWVQYQQCASSLIQYRDVIMGTVASRFTSLAIVYSTVYSDADQGKH